MSEIVSSPEEYFGRFIPDRDSLLIELEEEAHREEIPIVGPVVGELLFILVRATRARRILELGTATGYSSIYLANACKPFDGHLLTLENNRLMASRARSNFKKAGLAERVEVRICDALVELPKIKDVFDFIFMDIDKEDYFPALAHLELLLKKNALLVVDNVGFKDAKAFNATIAKHPAWASVALFSYLPLHSPNHDGLCLAVRR